jgi:hypothetical protein
MAQEIAQGGFLFFQMAPRRGQGSRLIREARPRALSLFQNDLPGVIGLWRGARGECDLDQTATKKYRGPKTYPETGGEP